MNCVRARLEESFSFLINNTVAEFAAIQLGLQQSAFIRESSVKESEWSYTINIYTCLLIWYLVSFEIFLQENQHSAYFLVNDLYTFPQ